MSEYFEGAEGFNDMKEEKEWHPMTPEEDEEFAKLFCMKTIVAAKNSIERR